MVPPARWRRSGGPTGGPPREVPVAQDVLDRARQGDRVRRGHVARGRPPRLGETAARSRDHRDAGAERFHDRHPEPLEKTGIQEERRALVQRRQLVGAHIVVHCDAGGHAARISQLPEHRRIATIAPHQHEERCVRWIEQRQRLDQHAMVLPPLQCADAEQVLARQPEPRAHRRGDGFGCRHGERRIARRGNDRHTFGVDAIPLDQVVPCLSADRHDPGQLANK